MGADARRRGRARAGDRRLDVAEFRSAVASCGEHGHPRPRHADGAWSRSHGPPRWPAGSSWPGSRSGTARISTTGSGSRRTGSAGGRAGAGAAGRSVCRGGAPEEAVAHARRLLALDPLHEPAHRRLMALYAQLGDRTGAVEQYRECVRVLERELGVAPLAETTDLYRAIVEGGARVARGGGPGPVAPEPRPRLPLTGRTDDLGRRVRGPRPGAWRRPPAGRRGRGGDRQDPARPRGAAAVPGEPASSRSGASRASRGWPTRRWRPRCGAPPPPTRRVGVRRRAVAARGRPARPRAPGGGTRAAGAGRPGRPDALRRGRRPGARAGDRPGGVLVVDDAQWADGPSVDLLMFLIRRLGEPGSRWR